MFKKSENAKKFTTTFFHNRISIRFNRTRLWQHNRNVCNFAKIRIKQHNFASKPKSVTTAEMVAVVMINCSKKGGCNAVLRIFFTTVLRSNINVTTITKLVIPENFLQFLYFNVSSCKSEITVSRPCLS